MRLEPILQERPWGGERLRSQLHKDLPAGARIGESWEVCDLLHDGRRQQCRVATGPQRGRFLGDLLEENGAGWFGASWRGSYEPGSFPLLVKFLDARETLSIQVHPNHEDCERLEGVRQGKTEAWVVLSAEPGARVYRGIRDGVGWAEARDLVRRGRVREILRSFPARAGDVVFLPPGTIHALGAGLVVAEVQEPSDYTYRIDDWGRTGTGGAARELHREKAAAVVRIAELGEGDVVTPALLCEGESARAERLVENPAFVLERWTLSATGAVTAADVRQGLQVFMVLSGRGGILTEDEAESFGAGDTFLFPDCASTWRIVPGEPSVLLRAAPGTRWAPRD